MGHFSVIVVRIIKEQELIIGPMAWFEAGKVKGLQIVDQKKGEVSFTGEEKETINKLVAQYERLFGKTSHAVCREAVQDLIAKLTPDQIPSSLK